MGDPAVLRVIFGDESDSRKLHLVSGIPETVDELHKMIKTCFQLNEDFRLQYMDADFSEFMNLTSVSEIQNKSTLKVIYTPLVSPVDPYITLYPVDQSDEVSVTSSPEGLPSSSSVASSSSNDTLYTSTPHSSPECQLSGLSAWPTVFVVPKFIYEAEFELQQKNYEFETNGTYFNPGPKLKGAILDGLAQEMMKYTKYPKDYQCEEVAAALTRAHPCLGQLGSKTGFWGWKQSLKYKMQNYRTKLGRLGHPEIRVNSLKHKREGQGKAAANIKKPRKAEVNYIPLHPKGETAESLENERIALLSELKKRDNEAVIKAKMEKTFSHRRLEVVEQRPMIGDFKNRWPALFEQSEVNAEFLRITTKPLQSKFLSQLDHFSDKLIQIFKSKGGVKGQKIKHILAIKDSCDDINIKRECILRSLIVYVNEDPDVFFKEYLPSAVEDAEMDIATTVIGIYTIRRDGHEEPEDVGVVIEGIKVLNNVGSVIMGFIMLFGLIYALDLAFPENLKYTFEFFQKIIMNLDGHKLNAKIQQLKIKLFL
nr:uncharacterized protein LOC124068860 isoform X2 [Scatophagus argus]XP_046263322.1 uncharacterized protein LOC124068860 isoform X2 [Scatophagus argus]XP_046269583.1 uncharacterized protein LOC124072313 isoform X3 [Scatophagus argus]XP_046269585.1 uncharacterized protein LOC124072313 isoform X3 [Scatophagus argus]